MDSDVKTISQRKHTECLSSRPIKLLAVLRCQLKYTTTEHSINEKNVSSFAPSSSRVNPVTLSWINLLKMEYQLIGRFEQYLRKNFFKATATVLKLNPKQQLKEELCQESVDPVIKEACI